MRSVNAPYPFQILQNDRYVALLFEQNTWFHVVPFRAEHSKDINPAGRLDDLAIAGPLEFLGPTATLRMLRQLLNMREDSLDQICGRSGIL
jgi:hypothetical protein